MKQVHSLLIAALVASQGHWTLAAPTDASANDAVIQVSRSENSGEDMATVGSDPDMEFRFPKSATFEVIQSLTELVAFEARQSQANPLPDDGNPSPNHPPKQKDPYKCACHCTIIFCGCTCKTLPAPKLPP